MTNLEQLKLELRRNPRRWLVTGTAGFIGSNLLEALLKLDQPVVGLDNFSTGYRENLEDVKMEVAGHQWSRFVFHEGDIRSIEDCKKACRGVEYVLHHAALGSVPRSIDDPVLTNQSNIDGFLNMVLAARDEGCKMFVYAASSATYGDDEGLPKVEGRIGRPLSPYALTKYVNELYADLFARVYGVRSIGLRYFNVFGKRQDPNGAYAAVIPRWIEILLDGGTPTIFGDGETSRDFCYIENVFDANLLAATTDGPGVLHQVYNIACGSRTSLKELFMMIQGGVRAHRPEATRREPAYGPFRGGDVRHSVADITRARGLLGYSARIDVSSGIEETVKWFARNK